MKKLSKILKESIWSDLQDRSSGSTIRKEDAFNPDYVDFGKNTTVYWAVNNLEIDGEVKFRFNEVKDYNNNGWRLPTPDEVNQVDWEQAKNNIMWSFGSWKINILGNVLKVKTAHNSGMNMWTCEEHKDYPSSAYAYGFRDGYEFRMTNFNKNCHLFAFLVKDKKSVNESIWSDLQDRSSGEVTRKEDDINLLDIKELCVYLKTIYKTDSDDDIRILEIEDDDHKINTYLVICLYEDEKGYYRYIYYDGTHIDTQLDVIETLNCRFEFERKFSTIHSTNDFNVVCIDIYPKDKARVPVTNKFFIEVLDFLLDRINTPLEQKIEKITESIWSDLQDRSSGEVVRKEDSTDLLEMNEFFDYLDEHYEALTNHKIRKYDAINCILVPICGKNRAPLPSKNLFISIDYSDDGFDKKVTIGAQMLEDVPYMNKVIREHFYVVDKPANKDRGAYAEIYSLEDGVDVTNTFILKTIDFLLDKAKDKYTILLKKK